MKRSFIILLAVMITFFTLPIGGITAFADEKPKEKTYDNIADGEYEIEVEALEENSEENSGADGFLLGKAELSVQGEEITLTLGYTKDFEMDYEIFWTKLEGKDPIVEESDDKAQYYSFELDELKSIYPAAMEYAVPSLPPMADGHEVDYRISLNKTELEELPLKEETEEPTEPETPETPEEPEDPEIIEIADGNYTIEFEALHAEEDKASGMARYIDNPASLSVEEGNILLTLTINDHETVTGFQVEKAGELIEPKDKKINREANTREVTYELDALLSTLKSQVQYSAMGHDGDQPLRLSFNEDSLEKVLAEPTEPETPEPEKAPEEREVGQLLTEEEADAVYELNFETDSKATSGQLENPVTLLKKDDKEYAQITVKESGAQFFRSLKFNGKEVTWNSITEGPYKIQFELPNGIEDELDVSMVIQAGPEAMPHDDIKLWFDEDSLETIKEPEPKPEEELNPTDLDEGVYTSDYTFMEAGTDNSSTMANFTEGPAYIKVDQDGKQYVAITFTSADWIKGFKVNDKDVKVLQENEKDNTRVVEFPIENLTEKQVGWVSVAVPGVYSAEHDVDLVFDADSLKSTKNNAYPENQNVKPSPEPSTPEDPESEKKPGKDPVTPTTPEKQSESIPDKAYEIDYIVKHETEDKASAADNFFEKPGHLLYIDGEKFIQLTINNWEMIDWLRTEPGGDVIVIKENDDGSALIQFKVEEDLSEVINLSMSITVPGVYEGREHKARLIVNTDSKTEVETNDFNVMIDKDDNPQKPKFGKGNGDGKDKSTDDKTVTPNQKDNPQTGDTTNILLYAMLLVGSLIPLGYKLKKRFI